jgi:hypothetical protein
MDEQEDGEMATFRVGQRVRLVKVSNNARGILGAECVITELDAKGRDKEGVFYIGHRLNKRNASGRWIIAPAGWIEPIQPEGNKVVNWEDCLWQPTKETV